MTTVNFLVVSTVLPSTVEGGVAHAEGVEVTAIGVADGVVAVGGSASVVGSAIAARLGTNCAGGEE